MGKHEQINLLFFLNAILCSVLEGLTGSFEKSAKYKFSKVVNCTNELEKDILRHCTKTAHETYADSVEAISQILNVSMQAYNDGNIGELLEYVNKFKTK
jgi:hypothetical protein